MALSNAARRAGSSAATAQRPGVHFDKTFTITAKATSICILSSLSALFDLGLKGIDVVKAFT
eukprot:2937794-Pleurochrysis_carterae.AAC.1